MALLDTTTLTDEGLADTIREAVSALNAAAEEAARRGIEVSTSTIAVTRMGSPVQSDLVTVSIRRVVAL